MESRLTFNQLICEFESRRPRQTVVRSQEQDAEKNKSAMTYVGRSLTAERRTVTASDEGSNPSDPPKTI
jgi:hypothetical protein